MTLAEAQRSHFEETHEVFCVFTSLAQWECKARSWLGGISGGGTKYKSAEKNIVCIDSVGRLCKIGADFMRADAECTFPVTVYQRVK